MLRRLQAFLVLGLWVVAMPAAAQEPADEPALDDTGDLTDELGAQEPAAESASEADEPASEADEPAPEDQESTEEVPAVAPTEAPSSEAMLSGQVGGEAIASPPTTEQEPAEQKRGFQTGISGYFRAPMTIGFSPRPGPDDLDGDPSMQISYGPNRTVDSNYYSFAYTRLQEQDWAELFFYAKKKHVFAAVGWMGYWYQSAGFRNPDAAWAPGLAYLTLDTDIELVAGKANQPNIALTAGSWWPKFGTFEKYDTYTLGRFRQLGEQLRLTVPITPDLTVVAVQGFGTGRDGSFNILAPAPYQATVGLDLLHYEHVSLAYKDLFDIGLHYNAQWTRDPNLTPQVVEAKAYANAKDAYLTTIGAEVNVRVPRAGSLWVSPSYIQVRNGWALAESGIEVMHSVGGDGFATNYMAWTNNPPDSTGTGQTFNLGFLYENSLSNIRGEEPGSAPEVTLNIFGLMANASLDLPPGSVVPQDEITQFKYGADLSVQALRWLGFMVRYDEVCYDVDHPGYVFAAVTPRVTVSSDFLSGERIYIQYSRYRYGDNMVLAGTWPWGQPLVAGSDIVQGGPYSGHKPDMDVIKVQADIAF